MEIIIHHMAFGLGYFLGILPGIIFVWLLISGLIFNIRLVLGLFRTNKGKRNVNDNEARSS